MNEPLLLVGAGGLARETAEAVRSSGSHRLAGFLDDDPSRHRTSLAGLPMLGSSEAVLDHPDARVVLCPGPGAARARLAGRLGSLGVGPERYATVVHPTAVLPASCRIGAGSVLLAGVVLTTAVTVGAHVVVMPGAVLTHDDVVEDFVTVCAGVALGGEVRVGTGAYLGAGALVRERRTVGAWSTLGMGAVVVDDVPPREVWVGNPARRLRAAPPPAEPAEPRLPAPA